MRLSLALGLLVASACSATGTADTQHFRVAVMKFQHETCTFCPGGDVTVEDWTRLGPPLDGRGPCSGPTGTSAASCRRPRTTATWSWSGSVARRRLRGFVPGWNTKETFDHFLDQMIEDLRAAAMPVDGVYLALHGAMAVRDVPRPEAEIARRFREVVGPDVPIAGTFDLHGNEDAEFLEQADFAFVTKRYPHYDAALQGARAARALHRAMRGLRAHHRDPKPGIITATVLQWTGASPSMDIMERARRWEARENDAFVSVFYGFPGPTCPTSEPPSTS